MIGKRKLQWGYLFIRKGTDKIAALSRTSAVQRLYSLMTNTRKIVAGFKCLELTGQNTTTCNISTSHLVQLTDITESASQKGHVSVKT